VLTRLDEIDGVQSSATNESGTLIVLDLAPGADPAKVAAQALRVVAEQVADRVSVPIAGRAAAVALQRETWQDKGQVAQEGVASAVQPPASHGSGLLAALVLGCAVAGLGLCGWRLHRRRAERAKGPSCVCAPL
jgi:hypothetical protein